MNSNSIFSLACNAFAILLVGCGGTPENSQGTGEGSNTERANIRLLVIDDSELAALIAEQWKTRSLDDDLEIHNATRAELAKAQRLSADVVLFPARWMGELAQRELIQPIPEDLLKDQEDTAALITVDDLLPTIRQCDVSWGRKIYGVTLGSPQFVLFYRPDLFAELKLDPPATWQEYQTVAEKLADRAALGKFAPPENAPWHAALEPTAAEWGGEMLLARAAASVRTEGQMFSLFNLDDMKARIAAPPFVQAAEQMAAAAKTGDMKEPLTPSEVRAAFLRGECGMAISWPVPAASAPSKIPLAFAELPGSTQTYSFQSQSWVEKIPDTDRRASLCAVAGHVAAVTREARRSRSAFQFLAWLSSGDTVRAVIPANRSAAPFTRSQLANASAWIGEAAPEAVNQYSEAVRESTDRAAWMPVIRMPGVDAYLEALDTAVSNVLADPTQAESALQTAAKRWDEITTRYDLTQHRRAYQRSLGNDY